MPALTVAARIDWLNFWCAATWGKCKCRQVRAQAKSRFQVRILGIENVRQMLLQAFKTNRKRVREGRERERGGV